MKATTAILCAALVVLGCGGAAMADVIAGWDFSDSNLASDFGVAVGTAGYVGGTTLSGLNTGASGASSDIGWNTTSYPAQGTSPKSAGALFAVSTIGYTGVSVTMDMRHSNTSANKVWLQYTTNGTDWTDAAFYTASAGDTWYPGRGFDLSGITAADNNASFAVRVVTDFNPDQYMPSTTTKSYATTGTLRFDNVVISGTPVPEPAGIASLLIGIVGCAGATRRRK